MKNSSDQIDFNFSRPIDFQKNLYLKEFDNLSKVFINEDKSLLVTHLKVLICELYYCWYESEDQFLTVSMSKRGYKSDSRYNPNKVSSLIIKGVKYLKSQELIDYFPGFYDSRKKISRLTRIRASKFLKDEFKKIKINSLNEINHKDREYLFLTDKEKKFLEYSDNYETHEIRNTLKSYNSLVSKTLFDIVCVNEKFLVRGDTRKVAISEVCKISNMNFFEDFQNLNAFSGTWWNKLDPHSINKYLNYILINDSDTSYVQLSEMLNLFLIKKFNITLSDSIFESKIFRNLDQKNYFKIKVISSKNFSGFFRSFSNDRKKLGFDEKISKSDLEKLINQICDFDSVWSKLFFSGKNLNWGGFLSNVFYNLIKTLANARIPVFLVGDRILFPTVMEKIFLDNLNNLLEKKFNFSSPNLKINQCYKKTSKKEKFFFSRFSKNNLKYSKRYERKIKEYKTIEKK